MTLFLDTIIENNYLHLLLFQVQHSSFFSYIASHLNNSWHYKETLDLSMRAHYLRFYSLNTTRMEIKNFEKLLSIYFIINRILMQVIIENKKYFFVILMI